MLIMNSPVYRLPENWEGLRVCLVWGGGVGDILMAIGGSTGHLKTKSCHITAAVRDICMELMTHVTGVDDVVPLTKLNDITFRNSFDVIIDFNYSINNSRQLVSKEYYSAITEHVGFPVSPGNLKFKKTNDSTDRFNVFLHPGATNPNRRWDESKWEETAFSIRDRGANVFWLGTSDEFGFSAKNIFKVSDTSENLVFQIKELASKANLFIGCDSGFAHIVGMLGITGHVLFFNTLADDVIGSYPTLSGIDVYDTLNLQPLREMRTDDPVAAKCRDKISSHLVIQKTGLFLREATKMPRAKSKSKKLQIGLYGNTAQADVIGSFLAQYYDVELLEEIENNTEQFDVMLIFTEDRVVARSSNGVEVTVNTHHPEIVRAAIREIAIQNNKSRS